MEKKKALLMGMAATAATYSFFVAETMIWQNRSLFEATIDPLNVVAAVLCGLLTVHIYKENK